ncbi:WD40 repeat domain-containing protein [Streptosporangium saharense]|uniref:WD40 repeat domain-containing protein n=1 Tax=Streptosporangium saharense TaxID=1706840 RepID=UPI00341A54F9
MEIDPCAEVALDAERYRAVMQWALKDHDPLDGSAHIQVGTLAGEGWYVRHLGFGGRRFGDKQAAWNAIRELMGRHKGRWEQIALNSGPFSTVFRPDGSRVLYDMNDDACLYSYWGRRKDPLWERFSTAIASGTTSRRTETHSLFEGYIELVEYDDPLDGSRRHAVITARDPGSDYRVVDHPQRRRAEAEYERAVYDNLDEDFPYQVCDIPSVPVDRRSRPPEGLTVLSSGTILDSGDLDAYRRMYLPPSRVEWPKAAVPAVPPAPVSGMTAEPRGWGPAEVEVRDVTPAVWGGTDGELRPNALALATLPDGRQLLASGHDGAAHIWSVGDGRSVRTFSGHSEWVLAVALTVLGDGRVALATGGKDGLARLWSAREGDALQELEAHRGPVNSVAWACPPGEAPLLVTGGDDATVRVWDVETELDIRTFQVGAAGVELVWSVAATVLSDGHVCVVAAAEDMEAAATVHVWDATTGQRSHEFVIEGDGLASAPPKVAVAPLADRSFRIAAVAGSVVRVWDGHTGQVVRTLSVPEDGGGDVALAVLPDLRVVVAATGGRETLAWDVESGTVLARLRHESDGFRKSVSLVARHDGALLLATGRENDNPARVLRLDIRW